MRPADPYHAVGESLQADVMRFMAIIAFCLIAILALVRSVAPEPRPEPPPAAIADAPAPAAGRMAAAPVREPDLPASLPREDSLPPREPAPLPRDPAPPQRESTVPVARAADPSLPEPPKPAAASGGRKPTASSGGRKPAAASGGRTLEPLPPAAAPAPAPAAAPAAETAASPAEAEGLSLRFASERDFLRLVNRGSIEVYAFDGARVLHLGRGLQFAPAAVSPGAVHELLPQTIPALMREALQRSADGAAGVADDGGFRWGIAMPARMARQVRGFVDQGATGELIIDRFGEVRLHGGA